MNWFKFKIKSYKNEVYFKDVFFVVFIFITSKEKAIEYIKKNAEEAFMNISYDQDLSEIKLHKNFGIYNEAYFLKYGKSAIFVNYKNRYKIGLDSFNDSPLKIDELPDMAERLKRHLNY